jgi:hypothetical protein
MSSLSWMDFSEEERRQALDLIDQLNESDTRDELGIGTIRDALADLLFPGTSTIQTRAKYFLFIPWMYQELERRKISSNRIASDARWVEIKLIEALLQSEDTDGVIGKEARSTLKRLPSNVYWQGLHRWGIRTFDGSQDPYHRSLDSYYTAQGQKMLKTDDGESLNGTYSNWHAGLPKKPDEFPYQASFHLTLVEAEYLRERILHRTPQTLLAYLVRLETPFERVVYPWDLPFTEELPEFLQQRLKHAELFSLNLHGAALLYNLMLAEQVKQEEWREDYTERLADWWTLMEKQSQELKQWSRADFWKTVTSEGARILPTTKAFVDEWLDILYEALVKQQSIIDLIELKRPRLLIKSRELSLKRGKARLDQPRALQMWNGDAGSSRLSYRWPTARTIVLDILNGCNGGDINV